MKNAVIVLNGDIKNYDFYRKIIENADIVIAADGGYRHCENLSIVPQVTVGDFDSFPIEKVKSKIVNKFNESKDFTDGEAACFYAIEHGYKSITIIGATSSRFDHSMANLFLLKQIYDKSGIIAKIIDESNKFYFLQNRLEITGKKGDLLSILPLSPKLEEITTTGLAYPLKNDEILFGSSIGISNVFQQENASITLKNGYAIVICPNED